MTPAVKLPLLSLLYPDYFPRQARKPALLLLPVRAWGYDMASQSSYGLHFALDYSSSVCCVVPVLASTDLEFASGGKQMHQSGEIPKPSEHCC